MPFIILTFIANVLFAGAMSYFYLDVNHMIIYYVVAFIFSFLIIVSFTMLIAVIYEYMMLYDKTPEPTPIKTREVRQGIFRNALKYGVTSIFVGGVITVLISIFFASAKSIGAVAFFSYLLFVYVGVIVSFVYIIRVVESQNIIKAFLRTFQLIAGNWWKTFSIFVITSLLSTCIILLPTLLANLLSSLFFGLSRGVAEGIMLLGVIVYLLFVFLSQMLTLIAVAFWYFSLTEVREGVGLLQKVERLGEVETTAATENVRGEEVR